MQPVNRHLLGFAFLAATVSASAQGPGSDCRTPLGIPCHSIHFKSSQWQNFKNGFLDIRHSRHTQVRAVRRDGSSYSGGQIQAYALLNKWLEGKTHTHLYLAPEDRVIRILHEKRSFTSREPMIWHDRPYRRSKDGDANCSTGIRHFGVDLRQTGTSTVAGVPVVKWERGDGRSWAEEVYLAPSLDCETLKSYMIRRTPWGPPTFIHSVEATSVEWGEPKAEFFVVPPDYQQIEDPMLPYLQRGRQAGISGTR